MKTPMFSYGFVGIAVGSLLNFLLIGNSTRIGDFLIGAISGLAIGVVLAVGKNNIWRRK